MRKSIVYLFLTCSLVLVLGHSLLPHNHIETKHIDCEIKDTKNLSLTEILKLALAHKLGANHLEEFKNCEKLEFTFGQKFNDFISCKEIVIYRKGNPSEGEDENFTYTISNLLDFILKNTPLRAPPVYHSVLIRL